MIRLDEPEIYRQLDTMNLYDQIDRLPEDLLEAWQLGMRLGLPDMGRIRQVVIAGMGKSALGAEILAQYAEVNSSTHVHVHRDYGLPGWAKGAETLVIVSSYSGGSEEVISALQTAVDNQCTVIAMTTGGRLEEIARSARLPLWKFEEQGVNPDALAYAFCLPLAILVKLGLLSDPGDELQSLVAVLKEQRLRLRKEVPAAQNPAKRTAGQLMGRFISVIASGILAPAARSWKNQLNEFAKTPARYEILPESDHNMIMESMRAEQIPLNEVVLFLRGDCEHPRNRLRGEMTRKLFMLQGIGTDYWDACGNTPLQNLWTIVHFGDYVAYYLAIAYGFDPSASPVIHGFKCKLGEQ